MRYSNFLSLVWDKLQKRLSLSTIAIAQLFRLCSLPTNVTLNFFLVNENMEIYILMLILQYLNCILYIS